VVDTVERKERTGVSLLSAVCCPLISNNHTPPPDPSGCETEASALAATLAERGKSTAAMFERVRVCRGGGAGAREEKKREEVGPEPNNESEKSQVENANVNWSKALFSRVKSAQSLSREERKPTRTFKSE
jgi:hypothetical protein